GNRDVLVSSGSYFFMSNINGEGEEWMKTLNKVVWLPFTGVFGQKLEDTVQYERRYGEQLAPLIVEQCAKFIRSRGLLEVGLFRLPGQATLVKELREAFDAGEKPSFDSSTDVHTVASLLKLYLRELPEPLVPFSKYEDFLLCAKLLAGGKEQGLVELKTLLQQLPNANFCLLHYICRLLDEVQFYSHINKMSATNLATVFGPNILRPKAEDPKTMIGGTALVQQLMSVLISEHRTLFIRESSRAAPNADSSPAGQGCAARIQKEDPTAPPRVLDGSQGCEIDRIWAQQLSLPFTARKGSSRNLKQENRPARSQSHIPSTRHRCQSKMENRSSEDPSPGGVSDHLYDSYCPGLACTVGQFLETETGIETGASSIPATTSCTTAAKDGPIPTITQSSWVEDCHEDTDSSAERRLSDPYESTFSVYDNIDSALLPTPLSPPPPISNLEDVTSVGSWSSSSCEILLEETSEASRCSSSRTAGGGSMELNLSSSLSLRPSSALTDNLGAGVVSSEVFLATQDNNPGNSPATRCLLAGLKQQMARQKAEYEAKIKRFILDEGKHEKEKNKVASMNLFKKTNTVLNISLLQDLQNKIPDSYKKKKGTALVQQLMSVLISEHRTLFIRESSRAAPNADSSPAGQGCAARIQKEDPTAPPRVLDGSQGCEIDRIWAQQLSLPFTARKGSSRNLKQENRPARSQSHIPSTRHRCQSKMENRSSEDPSPGGVSDHLYDSYCPGLACTVGQFLETETGIETGASSIPATTSCTTAAKDGPIPTITQSSWVEDCHEDTDSSAERRLSDPYESTFSVYDNIDSALLPTPLSPPPPISNLEDVTSVGSWSSSSCEILLEETSEASRCSSSRTAGGGSMELNLSSSLSLRPSSALTDNLGAGVVSSEVFLATQDNNPGNSPATRCLLAGLKQQMARQKAEYEAKIKSVEQRNEELELEVKNLHLNLEQQRKWYNIVEIKMRNAERAKADAEKRNAMLQREMEEFFDTFGDLTSEVKKTERIVQSF
ncbi:Rho GTPase-activating protein 24, partial [Acipenser ruthenus]